MIKNVIFDVGNILLLYRWPEAMEEAGLSPENARKVGLAVFDDPIWKEFDRGNISMEEMTGQYEERMPEFAKEIHYFMTHMAAWKIHREDVWERVKKLKEKGFGLYLLSNYAAELLAIHLEDTWVYPLFDGGVISYQVGALKPEKEIYEELWSRYGLDKQECIFFDDVLANVDASIRFGMPAVHIPANTPERLVQELDKLLEME